MVSSDGLDFLGEGEETSCSCMKSKNVSSFFEPVAIPDPK
jgi:hypothetical protein